MLNIFQSTDLNILADKFLQDLNQSCHGCSVFEEQLIIVPNISIQDWLDQRITKTNQISCRISYQIWLELERYWIEQFFKKKSETKLAPLSKPAMRWDLFSYLLHKSKDILKNKKHPLYNELRKILNKEDYSSSQEEIKRLWAYSEEMAEIFNNYIDLRADWLKNFFAKKEEIKLSDIIAEKEIFKQPEFMQEHYQTVLNTQHYLWLKLFKANYEHFLKVKAEFLASSQRGENADLLPKRFFIFTFEKFSEEKINYLMELAKFCDISLYLNTISNASLDDIKDIKWLRQIPFQYRVEKHLNSGQELVSRFGKLYREREKLLAKYQLFENITALEEKPKSKSKILQRLQDDMHRLDEENTINDGDFTNDESLKIFACHGFNRQLEVLRSEITKWLLADKSRKMEDILILTPSLLAGREGFYSIFPPDGGSDGRKLPSRLTGISNKETENLWLSLSGLYGFLLGDFDYLSLKSWFLLSNNCVAYDCDYEDLARILKSLYEAGFRRGFDEEHLKNLGIEDGDFRFSFSYALDRLALAYTMPKTQNYADQASSFKSIPNLKALNALTKFHEDICQLREFSKEDRFIRDIIILMRSRLHEIYAPNAKSQSVKAIDDALEEFGRRLGANQELKKDRDRLNLPWKFILNNLENILHNQRNSAEPSGVLTIGQLSAMQNLPYKLVALVGLENSQFPNKITDPRYNLIEIDRPRFGDISRENQDLASFLDILNSAQENCWIFYSSHDKENGEPTTPPAPIADLLQFLESNLEPENFQKIHLLQAPAPFSDYSDGAKLWVGVRENMNLNQELKPRFNYALRPSFKNFAPQKFPDFINIEDLTRTLKNPLLAHLRAKKIHFFEKYESLESYEPLEVGKLRRWQTDKYLWDNSFQTENHQLPIFPAGALGRKYGKIRAELLQRRLEDFKPNPCRIFQIKLANLVFSSSLPIDEKGDLLTNKSWNYFHLSSYKTKYKIEIYLKFLVWAANGVNQELRVNFYDKKNELGINWHLLPLDKNKAREKLFNLVSLGEYIKSYPFLFLPDIFDSDFLKFKLGEEEKFKAKLKNYYFSNLKNHQNPKLWKFFANDFSEPNYELFLDSFIDDYKIMDNLLGFENE